MFAPLAGVAGAPEGEPPARVAPEKLDAEPAFAVVAIGPALGAEGPAVDRRVRGEEPGVLQPRPADVGAVGVVGWVLFDDPAGGALLFATVARNTTSFTPGAARWASIVGRAGGSVRVTVVGSQTDKPATGPYRSCTQSFGAL